MDHRFLAHSEAHRPFAGGDLFARIGGRAAIDTLVDGLYDGIEVDAVLRPLFGRDLAWRTSGAVTRAIRCVGYFARPAQDRSRIQAEQLLNLGVNRIGPQ
jgi:hypothetical protein